VLWKFMSERRAQAHGVPRYYLMPSFTRS
jgi:hypothetical protein